MAWLVVITRTFTCFSLVQTDASDETRAKVDYASIEAGILRLKTTEISR